MKKGASLAFNMFIWGLLIIMGITFMFWLFISRYVSVQTNIIDASSERYVNDLANVFISNPTFCYVRDGIVYRDILDSSKLNEELLSKDAFMSDTSESYYRTTDNLYLNSVFLVEIMDLDSKKSWIAFYIYRFNDSELESEMNDVVSCIANKMKSNSDVFSWDDNENKLKQDPCSVYFLKDCLSKSPYVRVYSFKNSVIGIPVTIKYDSGTHVGRMFNCLFVFDKSKPRVPNIDIKR